MADEITAQFHALSVRLARAWVLGVAMTLVFWVVLFLRPELLPIATTMMFVVIVVQSRLGVMPGPVTWRAATRPLLAGQPWRETPVRVLNMAGTVLYLHSGEFVRVRALPQAAREVVVRAGRVWLVGPDSGGRLAVRVDGLYTAWPARRVSPQQTTAVLPTGEPIATMTVRVMTERLRAAARVFPFLALFHVALAVLFTVSDGEWWWFLGAAIFGVLAVVHRVSYRRLRRLWPTEPWVRTDASEPSWRVRRDGTAAGTVVLDFADGRRRTAHLDRAQLDLFANVRQEKTLWIAGNGVVGFPHYPVVAAARFTD